MAVSESIHSNLDRIKKDISSSWMYFHENYRRFHDFRRYVFKESVSEQQKAWLQQNQRPVAEFNILEAYLSRLLGEFSQHEPSIKVSPEEGYPTDEQIVDIVEGHLRHIIYTANKDSFSYETYKDTLAGGFSVAKVWTDYISPMSFDQKIYLSKAFDPTLCGFDPIARAPHKGDGRYCFEIYPMTLEDFKREFPDQENLNFSFIRADAEQSIEGFNWSYKDMQNKKIVLVVHFYEKKKKKVKILKLSNGKVLTQKDYKKLEEHWIASNYSEQIPLPVGNPRWTTLETVCRYRLVENAILEYTETDYGYLPLVFIDGNSILLTQGTSNCVYQMTRPYVYHAKGIQDLKNFAGQSLANFLENQIQHKFIIKKEAIPQEKDYLEALNDIQKANTVVVQAYSENDPDKPIPEPIREIQNLPAPPEVMGAFQITDPTTQTILGSFASNLGKNDNDLSGKAVVESASVGNAAAMPYVVGYLQGLTQIACIIIDLIPKYLIGGRVIPLIKLNGDKVQQAVNRRGLPSLNYDEKSLHVQIEAGVNFQIQKNQAVEQIIALMRTSESLGQFFNDEDGGLPILAKNLTIYGADELPEAIERWSKKKQQLQQQQMQMQQQMAMQDPAMIRAQAEAQKVQNQAQQQQVENELEIARLAIEKEKADADLITAHAKVNSEQIADAVRMEEAQTSRETHALDAAAKFAEIQSRQHNDHLKTIETHHKVTKE